MGRPVLLRVIAHVSFLLPSIVVTIMLAVPSAIPVVRPSDETVATPFDETFAISGLLELQVTILFEALSGNKVEVSVTVH